MLEEILIRFFLDGRVQDLGTTLVVPYLMARDVEVVRREEDIEDEDETDRSQRKTEA